MGLQSSSRLRTLPLKSADEPLLGGALNREFLKLASSITAPGFRGIRRCDDLLVGVLPQVDESGDLFDHLCGGGLDGFR